MCNKVTAPAAPASKFQLINEERVLLPPSKFGVVEPCLYRSSIPQEPNLPYLHVLALRSIVVLSTQRPHRTVLRFLNDNQIALHHVGADELVPLDSSQPIANSAIKRALELVLDPSRLPALVCDFGGLHQVGILVGVLRRLQSWNLNSVLGEYKSYSAHRSRFVIEQFIEMYNIEMVIIPNPSPEWFTRPAEIEEKERKEFELLVKEGAVNEKGTLKNTNKVPNFKVFYYSSNPPLNSMTGPKKPCIRTL